MNLDHLRDNLDAARAMLRAGAALPAARLVHVHLKHLDPDRAPALPVLIEAAALYTTVWPDHAWLRYLNRAHRQLPSTTSTGHPHTSPTGIPLIPDPLPDAAPAAGLDLGHRSWSVDLDTANGLHRRGRCGEAVRTASRALDNWQHHCPPPHAGRGLTLITGLTAMLSACLRDTDARVVLAQHHRRLPPPGHRDRHSFAIYALHTMDAAATDHQTLCPARLNLSVAALTATGDDGLPWPQRRNTWWLLLLTIGQEPE